MSLENAIARLLQDEPLYRKVEIGLKYWHPGYINDTAFQFYCPHEASHRTFKLSMAPEKLMDSFSGREYVEALKPFQSDTELEYVHYFVGRCQSCHKFTVHFLLHVFSEGTIKRELLEPSFHFSTAESEVYKKGLQHSGKLMMRKLGQWPSYQIRPDNTVYNFLKKENKEYYNKALICLSQNYGVAAFAYLRKIVESEIINIVEELAKGSSSDTEKISLLLSEYYKNKQTGPLVESIYQYLPNSLKVLGDNPFKLLYSHLSEGLHNLTDEECLGYAKALDKLLVFAIKKVKEEQNELKEIRSILGELRDKV